MPEEGKVAGERPEVREIVEEIEIDVRKPGRTRNRRVVGESLASTSVGVATLMSGLSRSIAAAFDEFEKKITPDNVLTFGLANGFIEGLAAGNAKFLDELAGTSRRTFEALRTTPAG